MEQSAGRLIIHIHTKCRWRWPQMKLKWKSLPIGQCTRYGNFWMVNTGFFLEIDISREPWGKSLQLPHANEVKCRPNTVYALQSNHPPISVQGAVRFDWLIVLWETKWNLYFVYQYAPEQAQSEGGLCCFRVYRNCSQLTLIEAHFGQIIVVFLWIKICRWDFWRRP